MDLLDINKIRDIQVKKNGYFIASSTSPHVALTYTVGLTDQCKPEYIMKDREPDPELLTKIIALYEDGAIKIDEPFDIKALRSDDGKRYSRAVIYKGTLYDAGPAIELQARYQRLRMDILAPMMVEVSNVDSVLSMEEGYNADTSYDYNTPRSLTAESGNTEFTTYSDLMERINKIAFLGGTTCAIEFTDDSTKTIITSLLKRHGFNVYIFHLHESEFTSVSWTHASQYMF